MKLEQITIILGSECDLGVKDGVIEFDYEDSHSYRVTTQVPHEVIRLHWEQGMDMVIRAGEKIYLVVSNDMLSGLVDLLDREEEGVGNGEDNLS